MYLQLGEMPKNYSPFSDHCVIVKEYNSVSQAACKWCKLHMNQSKIIVLITPSGLTATETRNITSAMPNAKTKFLWIVALSDLIFLQITKIQ